MSPLSSMAPSSLWQRIQADGLEVLAVMGMTKNTGKTVALNHLLAQAAAARVAVGLSSIGRDGEDRDQVFFIPKPPVRVGPGTLVATARATLARARLRYKPVAGTGIDSPMGEILIVRTLEGGEMEVAGASRGADQHTVVARLRQCGAALVLLDGALGRSHHASPALADGVILATGAALGGSIADVIRKTGERLALLGIAQADAATRALCAPVFAQGGVGLWDRQGTAQWLASIATLNAAPALLQHAREGLATVALSGAVGRSLWAALRTLAARHPGLSVVVADGTKLFVTAADLAELSAQGACLRADRAIQMTGITLNPSSPLDAGFDAADFLAAARQAFDGYGVSDVMLEAQTPSSLKETA